MPEFWGPPTLTKLRLSRPMKRVLANLRSGKPAEFGVSGRSAFGGHFGVLQALRERHLIVGLELTPLGREFADKIAEREGPTPLPAVAEPRDLPGQLRLPGVG